MELVLIRATLAGQDGPSGLDEHHDVHGAHPSTARLAAEGTCDSLWYVQESCRRLVSTVALHRGLLALLTIKDVANRFQSGPSDRPLVLVHPGRLLMQPEQQDVAAHVEHGVDAGGKKSQRARRDGGIH